MANIKVEKLAEPYIEDVEIEMVERKGAGHPDSMCDNAAETLSRKLSNWYLEKYGTVLHHNVDKAALVGGRSKPKFGGGIVTEPIYFALIGRAVCDIMRNGKLEKVPIQRLAREAITESLEETFRYMNLKTDIIIDSKIKSGSTDLVGLFDSKRKVPLANDTSFGVSHAPFSYTEKLVWEIEQFLQKEAIRRIPAIGEDIKVMGFRQNKNIKLTIATAMIDQLIDDMDSYVSIKNDITEAVLNQVPKIIDSSYNVEIDINQADIIEKNIAYITVTGTSAESGDDGQVGRGNRTNGLITPNRPMSLEAAAGKNPISHVGKIYNVLAGICANEIADNVDGAKDVEVRILSQIGKPISEPLIASVKVMPDKESAWNTIEYECQEIMKNKLENVTQMTNLFLHRKVSVW
ncbi:MAG: methionine adenosyltransferase [Candidatus Lokiarchaeota archaeon]|nr:methionine adenosyltransferase [Candidatus Lokiarchaeota archaeon]